jgi:hypothetical protein
MANTIAGFFTTREQAETAREALLDNGFSPDQISFVAGGTRPHEAPAIGPLKETGAESEMGQDVFVGGAIGLAVGLIAVLIPGVGALIAGGPIAGAIAGMSVGAGAGGLVGLLREHGISHEEAEFYSKGVAQGGALLVVHGTNAETEKHAEQIMTGHGAIGTEELAAGFLR